MSDKITGTGLAFPLQVDSAGRSIYVSGQELINQSLAIILLQPTNERFFAPEFGVRIEKLRYEPNDTILETLLKEFIVDAVEFWEKRIRIKNVQFEKQELPQNAIKCIISYQILGSNEEGIYVYPFYREINI
ncbi:GPW/gp25 family protein [Bernardetia sp. ABR2-2B]|uniref:GPW/gp25 family protein n=1 Tax=Bernardetia sp. ABR2-2B TaxID=3127472 RepID=UPI0030D4B5F7